MGRVTSSMTMKSDGQQVLTARQPEKNILSRADEIISFHYAYGEALLPTISTLEKGMWRYRNLLPLEDTPILYPLPVGDTPLIASAPLRKVVKLPHLWLKDETRTPTGSNKDRATALVLEHALREKRDIVTCASTGNVAVSLAVGAAAAGLKAVIFVPAQVADSKLKIMLLAGATVVKVAEGYETAFALSRKAAQEFGWCDRNTGINPLTLEAKKTVALEIWEQLGGVPDVIVVPVGDGLTLSAMVKGFRELQACGTIQRGPRVIGVQANSCQPIKLAWERHEQTTSRYVATSQTIADGIAVEMPVGAALALRDVQECGGSFVSVSDDAMVQAIQLLARNAGILAEPAGASALAGLTPALETGLIDPDEVVVIYVTGSGLKHPHYLSSANTAFCIDKKFAEVENIVQQLQF